jgi:hypothetical protein
LFLGTDGFLLKAVLKTNQVCSQASVGSMNLKADVETHVSQLSESGGGNPTCHNPKFPTISAVLPSRTPQVSHF